MQKKYSFLFVLIATALPAMMESCKEKARPPAVDIVEKKEAWESRTARNLQEHLSFALENKGKLSDSLGINHIYIVSNYYKERAYQLVWSNKGVSTYAANNLQQFIQNSRLYGLFPEDYNLDELKNLHKKMESDSNDATLYVRNDIFLTDAFISLAKDLKRGRLPYDSTTLRKDSMINDSVYLNLMRAAVSRNEVTSVLQSLEPQHAGYDSIKSYLPKWLEKADLRSKTKLNYPVKDSALFLQSLKRRMMEDSLIDPASSADTAKFSSAIRKYQKLHDLKITGKPNEALVKSLNNTDQEKFNRIALNLDRYKLLPDTLPTTYIWVNLPSFYLKLHDSGAVAFESRVIVGADKTRTPVLTSDITNFITYPQWTVPYSIIFKEMLPQIQKNVSYLEKQNLMVVDNNDSIIDPTTINWKKLGKDKFPYLLKQRQGDDNSLGVIKFNFRNKYSVYLHDTNGRWLFSKQQRALSHGCVRVQEWQKLVDFLTRNVQDKFPADTLKAWMKRQEKHVVSGFQRIPLYLRYFTVEGKKGKLQFYDDIYGDDRVLVDRYISRKTM